MQRFFSWHCKLESIKTSKRTNHEKNSIIKIIILLLSIFSTNVSASSTSKLIGSYRTQQGSLGVEINYLIKTIKDIQTINNNGSSVAKRFIKTTQRTKKHHIAIIIDQSNSIDETKIRVRARSLLSFLKEKINVRVDLHLFANAFQVACQSCTPSRALAQLERSEIPHNQRHLTLLHEALLRASRLLSRSHHKNEFRSILLLSDGINESRERQGYRFQDTVKGLSKNRVVLYPQIFSGKGEAIRKMANRTGGYAVKHGSDFWTALQNRSKYILNPKHDLTAGFYQLEITFEDNNTLQTRLSLPSIQATNQVATQKASTPQSQGRELLQSPLPLSFPHISYLWLLILCLFFLLGSRKLKLISLAYIKTHVPPSFLRMLDLLTSLFDHEQPSPLEPAPKPSLEISHASDALPRQTTIKTVHPRIQHSPLIQKEKSDRIGPAFDMDDDEICTIPQKCKARTNRSWKLLVRGTSYPIHEGYTSVGRSSKQDICIKEPSISRNHIDLLHVNGELFIIPKASQNGTLIEEIPLEIGERYQVNRSNITLELGGQEIQISRQT